MTTTTADESITLGVSGAGEDVVWNWRRDSVLLMTGPTGSGRSVACRNIALAALERGHRVIVLDPIKGGVDYSDLDGAAEVVMGTDAVLDKVAELRDENLGIACTLDYHDADNVSELPSSVRPHERFVIIDSNASFERCGGDDDDKRVKAAQWIVRLADHSRFAGLHVVVSSQRLPSGSAMHRMESLATARVALEVCGLGTFTADGDGGVPVLFQATAPATAERVSEVLGSRA